MASVEVKGTKQADDLLGKLPIEIRGKALKSAVRKAGNVVRKDARRRAPRGDKTHKPENTPIWKTIGTVIRSYSEDRRWIAVVGPLYPAGAHGHLVEHGHEVKVSRGSRVGQAPLSGSPRVEGKEFMAPAADATAAEQERVLMQTIRDAIVAAGG